ncbi:helix-turn-helix domain-containing protein [Enterococcus thailandicus]|uniref:Aspartate aminotransferase n=3 Tax=root TaxID=1 RepID=A0A510WH70_ENTTH|nr:helix-turn-helix domain-containing protein [Enterococcus thailandicus]OJG94502.1 hypothetical protein RV17_GL000308 [Enterococcus thailandicus]GEK36140.1 aspartate aminotransferase [Enterococcus thailandicus]
MIISNHFERELIILHIILTNKSTTLTLLSEEIAIPKLTIKGDILKLNNYFVEHTKNENDLIISNNQGIISINPMFSDNIITYFYQLKLALSNNSTLFRLCVLLLTNYSISKQQILDHLFISEAYLLKLCSQLNGYLSQFDLSVNSTNQIYSLKGNEICLRMFSYTILQDNFQGMEWPFDSTTPIVNFDNSNSAISLTKNHALYLFSEIVQQRFLNDNFLVIDPDDSLYDLLKLLQESYDVTKLFNKSPFENLSENVADSEKLYLNFFARIFLSDLISSEAKINLGRKFQEFDHPACRLANEIYSKFSNVFLEPISANENGIYLYYLTIFNILYSMIGDKYVLFLELMIPVPHLNINKTDDYMNRIKKEIAELFEDKALENYIAALLYTVSSFKKSTTLKLYIQMSKVFTAVYVIEKRIQTIFNTNNIVFTNNFSEADIVITDSFEKKSTDQILFYLDSINNSNRWIDLISLIQQKFIEKIDDRKKQ